MKFLYIIVTLIISPLIHGKSLKITKQEYNVVLTYPEWRCQDIAKKNASKWYEIHKGEKTARSYRNSCKDYGPIAKEFVDSKNYPGWTCANVKGDSQQSFWYVRTSGITSGKFFNGNCQSWGEFQDYRNLPTVSESKNKLKSILTKLECDYTKETEKGFLCALRASKTDHRINDGENLAGYGHHVIGIPLNFKLDSQIHVHFTGTYGKPFRTKTKEFSSETFLKDGMSSGRIMIQLAYDNEKSANEVCNSFGKKIDNCVGKIRLNKFNGTGAFALSNIDTADSVIFRLSKLHSYLKMRNLLAQKSSFVMENFEYSGHSQGANMALFTASLFNVIKVCLISGGYDSPDLINLRGERIADWMKKPMATSSRKINAIVHVLDPYYRPFSAAYDFLNLYHLANVEEIKKRRLTKASGELITNYHGATLGSIELSPLRQEACFR